MTATAGNGSAIVNWTPPSSDGGSPITGYTVSTQLTVPGTGLVPSPVTVGPSFGGVNITGLTNGASYTFTVTAANANGTGPASAPSNVVTLPTPPSPPTFVTAHAGGSNAVVVDWQAPATDGGSPITSYTVSTMGGPVAIAPVTVSAPTSSATINGLTNGITYQFTVVANNAIGPSPDSSASNPVTPVFNQASPNNTSANPVNLGSITCGQTVAAPQGDNTAGTHAWYKVTLGGLCTLNIHLSGSQPGSPPPPLTDSFTIYQDSPTTAPLATLVTDFNITISFTATYFIDVSGGNAGALFTLTIH